MKYDVGLAADHAGFELKEHVKHILTDRKLTIKDFGTHSEISCDYADFAHPLALAIETGECACGIAFCGSGNGINMTLNKHQHIRAALCWMPELASLAKRHNDANILVLPGRFVTPYVAGLIVDAYFNATFEGGRHQARIDKIPCQL
ncbi:MAG: RpiB/LacA/LacB family sugar-phosphate isomerase [Prevotellaceae bacterium]|nr:RpiB/LacA/LacB family sugar-phosphate isomerase [Prevotellaceae bacterium]